MKNKMKKTLKALALIIATVGLATVIKRMNESEVYVNENGIVRTKR